MVKQRILKFIFCILILFTSCQNNSAAQDTVLRGSGTMSAREVRIASEVAGRVAVVYVSEGEQVQAGQTLFELDTELYQAQREQASAALETARRTSASAEAALASARLQAEQVLAAARAALPAARQSIWNSALPEEIIQPAWYFQRSEEINAAEAEERASLDALNAAEQQLNDLLNQSSHQPLVNAERRLAQAQTAFLIAKQVLDEAKNARTESQLLVDAAQKDYDSTLNELEAAQSAYDNLLTTSAADELNQSRADLAVAQARYDLAMTRHEILLIGDQSRSVAAAQSAVSQAEAALEQARAAEKQVEANLNLIDVQLKKCVITSPLDGVVLARNLETGEVVTPGSAMIVIGKLDPLTLTAYLPEDQYGRVTLGQSVKVTVDSFPGETFSGKVTLIADQAEFTPRNVQTTEGRQGTVFGIHIEVENPDMKLKPGMPADVIFEE